MIIGSQMFCTNLVYKRKFILMLIVTTMALLQRLPKEHPIKRCTWQSIARSVDECSLMPSLTGEKPSIGPILTFYRLSRESDH